MFPLIQLPRKSEVVLLAAENKTSLFPLIQLPRKSEDYSCEPVFGWYDCEKFPLIQLPRKSEETLSETEQDAAYKFPLIQLPRKSEAIGVNGLIVVQNMRVSINSTSEEVRSFNLRYF